MIPIEHFGKDHWSLLAFIETRCVDYAGRLDFDRMRVHPTHHSYEYSFRVYPRLKMLAGWKPTWGTILKDGSVLADHDDVDCLHDLEAADLVEDCTDEELDGVRVRLTQQGMYAASLLRTFKANGGQYKDFSFGVIKK